MMIIIMHGGKKRQDLHSLNKYVVIQILHFVSLYRFSNVYMELFKFHIHRHTYMYTCFVETNPDISKTFVLIKFIDVNFFCQYLSHIFKHTL